MQIEMGQRMHLEQQLVQQLREELRLKLGDFERQILDKVKFQNVDLSSPSSRYHIDMLRALIVRASEDEHSLLGKIVTDSGATEKDIQQVIVESFNQADISFGIGQKRNVDRIVLVMENGMVAEMTVSLDKEYVTDASASPSLREAAILSGRDQDRVWSVQQCYGSTVLEDKEGIRGIVCKEFLEGEMLANLLTDIEDAVARYGEDHLRNVARSVGKMIANALTEFGGVPEDSHSLNIIVTHPEGKDVQTRYCDVEGIRKDQKGITHELKMLKAEFGKFAEDFITSLREDYKGEVSLAS